MKHCIALLLAAMAALVLNGKAEAADPFRYDLKAFVEPSAGTIAVTGTIDVPAQAGELRFALHRTLEISALTVNGNPADFTYEKAGPTPAARFVTVKLPPEAVGKPLHVAISYHGALEKIPEWGSAPDQKFGMDDQINGKLVYLAVYSFWYPYIGAFGQRFDTDLELSLPKGWTVVGGGDYQAAKGAGGRAVTRWRVKDNFDIAVTASPSFHRSTAKGVEVYYVNTPKPVVTNEAKNLAAVMALFERWLGKTAVPGGVVRHVYAPLEHGQGRAGIARPGLIITSEGRVREAMAADPHYSLLQDISHEIAHFWWNSGAGQGDWINEAFAEYFSALSVKQLVSDEAFESALARYRKGVAGLPADAPSLATVPKEGGDMVWTVRYQKGSLMLDGVRRIMGDDAFLRAAREFFQTYRNKPTGTAEFRAFWGARLGDKKAWLDTWLDTGGGMPPS